MKIRAIAITILTLAVVSIVALAGFVYSGFYNVAASESDNPMMRWVLITTRDRSIDRRAAGITVPPLTDPQMIQEGFEHYHEMCTGCHLAPGVDSSEIREGLNPQPPVLAKVVPHSSPARLFWVIKNGVAMTGMPAWGASHSDQMIWAMVAFLERLPAMTPAEYQSMENKLGDSTDTEDSVTPRQKDVAEKGAMVMPFNIHNSTHVFQNTPTGGVQQVVAKDAGDKDLLSAIRGHLSMEADRFKQGNYSDPMKIHGMDMPGVQYLSAVKPGQIIIVYRELPNGAEILYTGKDGATVEAIHKWFDAQLSDHGNDATDKLPAQ